MNKDDLQDLLNDAEIAFWDVIAKGFPEATTGDLSPWATIRLSQAQENAVKEWIGNNVTTEESQITPGYRFKLFHDVDRFPDFKARCGLTGTVTQADDVGVWARMDEQIAGAEQWENQIHWVSPYEFAADTVPV